MKKSQKNMPLFWGSIVLLGIVLLAVIVNYIGSVSQWSEKDLAGLRMTIQDPNTLYLGERYICDKDLELYIQIVGSKSNIRDRTATITMVDSYSGPARVENMKIKEILSNGTVEYAYKENSLFINKDGIARFSIFNGMLDQPVDIPVLKNCVRSKK